VGSTNQLLPAATADADDRHVVGTGPASHLGKEFDHDDHINLQQRGAWYPGARHSGPYEPERPYRHRPFWVGAALAAGISALVAFIALIISNDLLHIPVLIREGSHLAVVGYGAYALTAAAAAVAASVLYTVLLHFAPRPGLYYRWIVGLVTVLVVLLSLIPLPWEPHWPPSWRRPGSIWSLVW